MNIGPGRVRLEAEHVLLAPTAWGWLRGQRPVRIRYDHIRHVQMRVRRGSRAGELVLATTCSGEPFVLAFRRSRSAEVAVTAHELAARCATDAWRPHASAA
ncbi:MAG TPA: hypothetical protein VFY86_06955 [Nocardioides sp.]|nr:hypothetical protein [Nocardioides sp.]